MFRHSFSPFRGSVLANFVGALAGFDLLRLGQISQKDFDAMDQGRSPGKRARARSKYIPAGPNRNCGHGFYGMRPVSRVAE